jgi:hypothetical protein
LECFTQPDCVKPRSSQELAEAARRILERQNQVDPRQRFEKMVERGLIDDDGRLTREYGGEAEPAPHARRGAAR